MVKEITDSSMLLTKEDEQILQKIDVIKNNIKAYIGNELIVEKIMGFIDESELFDFKNQRTRKFINLKRPLFILKFNEKAAKERHPELTSNENYDLVTACLHEDVIEHFSTFLVSSIKEKNTFVSILKKNGINLNEKDYSNTTLISFITASIFTITIEKDSGTIYFEYII